MITNSASNPQGRQRFLTSAPAPSYCLKWLTARYAKTPTAHDDCTCLVLRHLGMTRFSTCRDKVQSYPWDTDATNSRSAIIPTDPICYSQPQLIKKYLQFSRNSASMVMWGYRAGRRTTSDRGRCLWNQAAFAGLRNTFPQPFAPHNSSSSTDIPSSKTDHWQRYVLLVRLEIQRSNPQQRAHSLHWWITEQIFTNLTIRSSDFSWDFFFPLFHW